MQASQVLSHRSQQTILCMDKPRFVLRTARWWKRHTSLQRTRFHCSGDLRLVCGCSKYMSYLRLFKVAPFALMTTSHTFGILSTSFIWNAFPTVLKKFPHMLSTCWLLFLHSAVQLIPNHLKVCPSKSKPDGMTYHCRMLW